ncbi:MAG: hypothetical protein AAFV62_12565 [Pseudomonadota bacterium]
MSNPSSSTTEADLTALLAEPCRDPWRRLDQYRFSVRSQNGEDGLIAYLVKHFPEISKTCLEVGAVDGVTVSNCWRLWHEFGWKALLIEGNPKLFAELQRTTATASNVTLHDAMIAPTGATSLDAIVVAKGFSADLGVLSLDIDSNEYRVLESIRDLKPAVMLIEFNEEIPVEIDYADPSEAPFLRHSAKALDRLGRSLGYRTVACAGPNVIQLREDLITPERAHLVPDLPIEALFDFDWVRKRQLCTQPIRAKTYTLRTAYNRAPTIGARISSVSYSAFMMLRALIRRRPIGALSVPGPVREAARRSGLWT